MAAVRLLIPPSAQIFTDSAASRDERRPRRPDPSSQSASSCTTSPAIRTPRTPCSSASAYAVSDARRVSASHPAGTPLAARSEEHTSELQSRQNLAFRLLLL